MFRLRADAIAIAVSWSLLLGAGDTASSDELYVLSPAAMRTSMLALIPEFERLSGQRIKLDFGPAGALAGRIQKGEALDVGIVTGGQIDELQEHGKIVAGTKVNLARVGMGLFARKGAAKPDIRSVEGFRRALLAAKFIGHNDPASGAPSGIFAARLLSSLDIAAAIKMKIKVFPAGTAAIYRAVEMGDMDFGLGQITEIMARPGVELVGLLPDEIQNYTLFAGGIATMSMQRDASKSFISYLGTSAAASVMKANGLEPL